MRRLLMLAILLVALFAGLAAAGNLGLGPLVVTREDEQRLILRLGEVRRVTHPGLSLRVPLLETAQTYDRRWLYLSTEALPIQTKDGEQLTVDNYVIWRIDDAVRFRRSFPGGMRDAEERIDRTVRDDVREVIGRHTLTEVLKDARVAIMGAITRQSREALADEGISVADVRINRTELPEGTEESVYARMKTERERLAKKNRAEGLEQARKMRAEADREARVIVANAQRDAEIARGTGDAEAARIYAEAYSTAPEFYDFQRSLQAYRKTIGAGTTLVLSPDTEFFQLFQGTKSWRGRVPSGGASAENPD
ncbi:MAG: protease modulator HflC [Planctomycetota bacterium]|jgi:membrane protease subunit HflC